MSDTLTESDINEILEKLKTPEDAKQFLIDVGLLNESGELKEQYK